LFEQDLGVVKEDNILGEKVIFMLKLSNFAERLKELMLDNYKSKEDLMRVANVNRNSINRYLSGKGFPSIDVLVKLADYFNCTMNFLLGLESENYVCHFKTLPDFGERLNFIIDKFNVNCKKLITEAGLTESALYYWKNNTHRPRVHEVYKLAVYFGCTMDYVLGRGD